jgi:tetratricopeptide (TPR) repeat protein
MSKDLTKALSLHQTGQWAGAARLYTQILTRHPDDPDALHLLGVLHHQQGQHARAAELIGRAVNLRPDAAAFHCNLAEPYRALGQHERAAECCRTALRLEPNNPEALCGLGLSLAGLGRWSEAVGYYHQVLRLHPDYLPAHNALGLALRHLGQLEAAQAHFGWAVHMSPTAVPPRANLARLLLDRGRPADALPHCCEAVRLQPDSAELHHLLGNAMRDLKNFAQAEAGYREALRRAPNFVQAQADLGRLLRQQGRLLDALPWLKRAAEGNEQDLSAWVALAEVYEELGRSAETIPCWQRVLALDPGYLDAHLYLGWALQQQGKRTEAAACFQTLLRSQPHSPAPHIALAGLHEEQGDLAEAEAALREALRLRPNFAPAYARLAKLLGGKMTDADRAAIEEQLTDPRLPPDVRTSLLFGLAQFFDARGEFARAAAVAQQANTLTAEWMRGRRDYDPAKHQLLVDEMVRVFDRDFFARVAGWGLPTRQPVFVVGLPRSGTTLVEQVLASHSRVFGAGELHLGRETLAAIPAVLGGSDPPLACIPHLDSPALRRLAEQHLEKLRARDEGQAERIVDKLPDNYQVLGLLAALFPQATFIHCRRDLRDVAVSCWLTDFTSIPWANDVQGIAARFGQYLRLMAHWRKVLPVPLHEVVYEEMVGDLEGTARRLIAACGLDWEPACLEFYRTRRSVRTASVAQVRQPVYTRSVGRWKNYEPHLASLFAALPHEQRAA